VTIPTESSTTEIYVGTGLVDTYAYAFLVNDETDLTVKIRNTIDEETTLVLNTDYTVTGVGNPNGGDVVLSSTLVLNYKLVAYRDMPYLQEIDLTNQEAFFLESMEDGLDNVTMLVQQLSAKAERGVYREETDDSEIPTFTEIADYATSAATSAASAAASALVVQNTWKSPATCKTTANITLSGEQTIDGVATSVSRVLVANQTDQKENGIYLSATGAWSRSVDADIATELNACIVPVSGGTLYHDTIWMEESVVSELGVDNVTFGRKDNGYVGLTALDIDGGTDIGAAVTDNMLIPIDKDGAGANVKCSASRILSYAKAQMKSADFEAKDLIISVASNTTVSCSLSVLSLLNSSYAKEWLYNKSYTFNIASNLEAGTTEKASTWYQLWIDSDETLKLVPDLTGTADANVANSLSCSTLTAVTDLVHAWDEIYQTTDNTKGYVKAVSAEGLLTCQDIDGADLDLFPDGNETFIIRKMSPVGLGAFKSNVGKAYNDVSSNFSYVQRKAKQLPRVTTARWHTQNGHGSTNTKIPKLTTEVEPSDNVVATIVMDSATLGNYVTANMRCNIEICVSISYAAATSFCGVSLNSSQLTTDIDGITAGDRLAVTAQTTTNNPMNLSWTGDVDALDTIRIHDQGVVNGVVQFCTVTIKATEILED
jgi:hypothetical protein